MPQISCFLGNVILMFYNDHNPPHFMRFYGESEAVIYINKLEIKDGYLPSRVLGLVIEWASLNQSQLRENWERARNQETLKLIAPLV